MNADGKPTKKDLLRGMTVKTPDGKKAIFLELGKKNNDMSWVITEEGGKIAVVTEGLLKATWRHG